MIDQISTYLDILQWVLIVYLLSRVYILNGALSRTIDTLSYTIDALGELGKWMKNKYPQGNSKFRDRVDEMMKQQKKKP